MKSVLAFVCLFVNSLTLAQEFSLGQCPPFPTVKKFNPQRVSYQEIKYIFLREIKTIQKIITHDFATF